MKWKPSELNSLETWFKANKRPLPWRSTSDPYKIWISEVMLQQTTVTAVIPFFKRFIKRLPTVKKLSAAREETVKELWTGLGYYSRAKNLHKSGKILAKHKDFPQTYTELIKLPGFGDYTSRSVSSIAFKEPVGVVDGNIIRVFSRRFNKPWQWWKTADKKEIQNLADDAVAGRDSSDINQALMELGATICTPKKPACLMCPFLKNCEGRKAGTFLELPTKRKKKPVEIWKLDFTINQNGEKFLLTQNTKAPFLKNEYLFPLRAKKLADKPKKYDFKHSITNHNIFVTVKKKKAATKASKNSKWVTQSSIKKVSPFSLIQKSLEHISK